MNIIFTLISFALGFLVGHYKEKIKITIKQFLFLVRNYKAFQKSKYYNEFYEDYISSFDYERSDI